MTEPGGNEKIRDAVVLNCYNVLNRACGRINLRGEVVVNYFPLGRMCILTS